MQGITTVTVLEPDSANGIVYNFSGNGCEVVLNELSFKTDKSFMSSHSLPQIINEIFASAQQTDALVYTESETPSASTLTTAIFNGKCSRFSYEISTDYESGHIKQISVSDYNLILRFAYK